MGCDRASEREQVVPLGTRLALAIDFIDDRRLNVLGASELGEVLGEQLIDADNAQAKLVAQGDRGAGDVGRFDSEDAKAPPLDRAADFVVELVSLDIADRRRLVAA